MSKTKFKKISIVIGHAFVLWALCGAIMGICLSFFETDFALIIHAIAAPILAAFVSFVYFRKFHYTSPFQTAIIFLLLVIIMDAGLVAPVFVKSFEMFINPLGTWIPFVLIFLSTFTVGLIIKSRRGLD